MATFSYKARDRKGEMISGLIEADNAGMVSGRLQSMGYFPVAIDQAKKPGAATDAINRWLGQGRVRKSDLVEFNRQMADLISSGIQLVKALTLISSQAVNPAFKRILEDLTESVAGGDSLADGMGKHPAVFSPLAVAMVRAGETGGMLDQVMQRLADFSESQEEVRGKIKSALAYPAVMVLAGTAAVTVLVTVVIPKVAGMFKDMNQALPLPTQILMFVSGFISHYYPFIIIGLLAGIIALVQFSKTSRGGKVISGFMLRLPIFGKVILKREVAAFCRTLGELVRNGVPILTSFTIAQRVVANKVIAEEVSRAPEAISQGSSVAASLNQSKRLPPMVINMIAIGEETGHLPESLLKIASSYEMQVDRAMKTLTSLLEPIIILVMGVIVGTIVIAGLLPIFSIDPTQGR